MPSIHVRGQANLHDSADQGKCCNHNSNKRQKVHIMISQSSTHSFNMQPDQEVNDHHHHHADQLPPKQVAARGAADQKEEEAAALLHHLHHADNIDHHASVHRMHIDHDHDDDGAPGDRARGILDRGMLRQAAHGARENSGSSDSSAAYFSGDSDLTAEPIMGRCATDDNEADGAKSSNSGSSSTPILKRKNPLTLNIDQTHQAPIPAGYGAQANCGNLPVFNEKMCNGNDEVGYPSQLTHTTALIAPSTSTTSASHECKKLLDFETSLMSSPERMRVQHIQEQQTSRCRQCSTSPRPEYADSGRKLTESWLELRLGFLHESIRQGPMQAAQNHNEFGHGKREWGEAEYTDAMDQERVTLQLLPEGHPNETETCSGGKGMKPLILAQEPPVPAIASSIPHAFYTSNSTSTFRSQINATGHFNMNPHSMTSLSCGRPLLHNQARDPASSAPSQYLDQFLHLNQTSNQSYRHLSRLPGSYEQRAIAYNDMPESNGQRRWASTESLDMMVTGPVQPPTSMDTSAIAQPPEVYRPTASLGWPPGTALIPAGAEGRPWSASSNIHSTIPQAQLQNNMSWQGLLRSMANDPLLHAHNLRGVSMQSFSNGANILQSTSGMRRRQMFPPACSRSTPLSHVTTSAAAAPDQRLQLTSLRRSTDLWFSLQEADQDFADEDQLSHHPKQKLYLRIRDGKMQISVVKSYLISKLGTAGLHLYNPDEVEITCRGQILSPSLTMQHVRDTIWFSKDVEIETIGFQYATRPIKDSQNRVMALYYQKHHTSQAVTLNLLKI